MAKRSSRPMRLPNGFGSIVKLSGNRRNPYMARPPVTEYLDNGSPVVPKAIGYYPDWPTAYTALLEYRQNPYDIDMRSLTFAEVFDRMIQEKMSSNKNFSSSTYYTYRAGFKNAQALHKMKMNEIRLIHLQEVVDNCTLKHASIEHIVKNYHQMFAYACKYDICEKDYSKFVVINKNDDDEKGVPFTEDEIRLFWKHSDNNIAAALLVMIYSGLRIEEAYTDKIDFSAGLFLGGVKTEAGKNRIVPIHHYIIDLVRRLYTPQRGVIGMPPQQFRAEMYQFLFDLGLTKHTPHDCRHTFSWLCDKYHVNTLSKKMIMGHSLGNDVTDAVYGHRTESELRLEIEKISFR